MKKGITPVIAIILLLLITIAIIGFAFVYLNRIASQTGASVEEDLNTQLGNQAQRISIVNIDSGSYIITLRNTGTASVARSVISVFNNNAAVSCSWTGNDPIGIGEIATCDGGASCTSGNTIRVVAPGGEDTLQCP